MRRPYAPPNVIGTLLAPRDICQEWVHVSQLLLMYARIYESMMWNLDARGPILTDSLLDFELPDVVQ